MSTYTIQQLADMKGTSAPVRAALLAMQAEIERLKSRLAHVEKMYVEAAIKGPKP